MGAAGCMLLAHRAPGRSTCPSAGSCCRRRLPPPPPKKKKQKKTQKKENKRTRLRAWGATPRARRPGERVGAAAGRAHTHKSVHKQSHQPFCPWPHPCGHSPLSRTVSVVYLSRLLLCPVSVMPNPAAQTCTAAAEGAQEARLSCRAVRRRRGAVVVPCSCPRVQQAQAGVARCARAVPPQRRLPGMPCAAALAFMPGIGWSQCGRRAGGTLDSVARATMATSFEGSDVGFLRFR